VEQVRAEWERMTARCRVLEERNAELERRAATAEAKLARIESGEDYDPHAIKVMHLAANPLRNAEVAKLQSENRDLREQLAKLSGAAAPQPPPPPPATTTKAPNEVDQAKYAERLKKVFATQIAEFRELIAAALGY
jgi:septal ring factor EnvC (AmiA/AmiB activator)